ncbi:MAG: ABC transporter substrate-binding protein [Thermostichus sp. DG_1_6_bins_120]
MAVTENRTQPIRSGIIWVVLLWWGILGLSACGIPSRPHLIGTVTSDPKTFNTYLAAESSSRDAITYLEEGLVTLDENTLLPKPQLAESWEVFDNGLRYVFTLREGLRWSDGEPLTAADVDFTFNRIIFDERIPTSSRDVKRIGESGALPQVRALDERRVEFVLPEPFAPFLIQAGSPILPKHILEPTVEQVDSRGNPLFLQTWGIDTPVEELVGAGPYVLQEYTPGQRLVYRPNPYYWKGEGLPRIERLILRIVDSEDTALLQFRSRETDVLSVRGGDFQLLKREEERDQFTIYDLGQTLNNNFFAFNLSRARNPQTGRPFVDPVKSRWFNDLNFRKAVAHAMNRQAYVDSVLQGLGEIQHSVFSPASPFYLSPAEGLPTYEYNPDKARQLLLEAGYTYDDQAHLRDPEGNRVRFSLITNAGNNQREATGSLIKADLERIGITVDFTPIAFNTLVQRTDARDWETLLLGFGGGGTEPNNGSNIWRSDGRLHLFNLGDLPNNPAEGVEVSDWEREIDRIFIAGVRELEFEKRKALYDRFQIIIQEQLPQIGTFNPLVLSAIRNRVEGVDPRPILGPLWNLEQLYIQE